MDPRAFTKKGYDTDLLILRTLFALNPTTNLPISSFYVATTDGIGGLHWLSAIDYISAATGIANLPSTLVFLSTGLSSINGIEFSTTSNLLYRISNIDFSGVITPTQLTSTTTGLGTLSFLSSLTLQSTLVGLGSANYISSPSLVSTVAGLGTASYISAAGLSNYTGSAFASSFTWLLDPVRYISTGNLLSTSQNFIDRFTNLNFGSNISSVVVYGTLNQSNISIGIQNVYIQDVSTLSTSVGFQIQNLSSALYNNQLGFVTSTNLFSTIAGLGNASYVSTSGLVSSIQGLGLVGYVSSASLTSTITGLGSLNYLSSLSLLSTVAGLGTAGYISSVGATQGVLNSTIDGLGTANYVSTSALLSTVTGLGTAGYISSIGATQGVINSTIDGLGTLNFISTLSLQSTLRGLGSLDFISSLSLQSTVRGLGTSGYISASQFYSSFATILNPGNYVSTGNLVSTTIGLANSFVITTASNINVIGDVKLTVTNNSNIIYLSSFLYSSIVYRGENRTLTASNTLNPLYNSDLLFSTANLQLDSFSSYITSKSIVTIDAYPSLFFSPLANSQFSGKFLPINVSSFIRYGASNFLSTQISQSLYYPTVTTSGASNSFNTPIRITVPGTLICNVYAQRPFTLNHYLPNAVSYLASNGFVDASVSCYFGSTNSVFLSIQNLPS